MRVKMSNSLVAHFIANSPGVVVLHTMLVLLLVLSSI